MPTPCASTWHSCHLSVAKIRNKVETPLHLNAAPLIYVRPPHRVQKRIANNRLGYRPGISRKLGDLEICFYIVQTEPEPSNLSASTQHLPHTVCTGRPRHVTLSVHPPPEELPCTVHTHLYKKPKRKYQQNAGVSSRRNIMHLQSRAVSSPGRFKPPTAQYSGAVTLQRYQWNDGRRALTSNSPGRCFGFQLRAVGLSARCVHGEPKQRTSAWQQAALPCRTRNSGSMVADGASYAQGRGAC